ncbi:hypothetical protein FCV25MIE_18928 [Fagus crenata]
MLRRRSLRKQETHSINNLRSKRRRATIESCFDTVGDDNESIETPELCSRSLPQVATSSKPKKRKTSKGDKDIEHVAEAIRNLAAAIREGNSIYKRCLVRLPIPEEEVVTLLDNIGIEPSLQTTAYLYLIRNPDMLPALIGYPIEGRKELLLTMMSDPSIPPTI